jgi:hypothetical protein
VLAVVAVLVAARAGAQAAPVRVPNGNVLGRALFERSLVGHPGEHAPWVSPLKIGDSTLVRTGCHVVYPDDTCADPPATPRTLVPVRFAWHVLLGAWQYRLRWPGVNHRVLPAATATRLVLAPGACAPGALLGADGSTTTSDTAAAASVLTHRGGLGYAVVYALDARGPHP